MASKKKYISSTRRRMYELDAKTIAYFRRNPCIACEDLLGIKLLDSQKYVLQGMWNAKRTVAVCSRNWGKSLIIAICALLKAILYENMNIYIVSSVGSQAKETFTKIEELVTRTGKTSGSFKSLKDIAANETKKSPTNKTGFSHPAEGYEVHFHNGSSIYTVNSNVDNIRGKRADLIFFDEAAFCSDELIAVVEAYSTQSSDFVTSTDEDYNPELEPLKVPTQIVYASSQSHMNTYFYKMYKTTVKNMLAGSRDDFAVDMDINTAIQTYMNGKRYSPLLTMDRVESALAANKEKALREYYNQPQLDGGQNSIVRWGAIRRNECFYLPSLHWDPGYKYIIATDPARSVDNSITGVMAVYEDPELGICGRICNCVNFVDIASAKHYKLDSRRQVEELRRILMDYSGKADYEFVDMALMDAGSGGGGVSAYADNLMYNWVDIKGVEHRGLIDLTYDLYSDGTYEDMYPDAVNKLRLINPRKYRTQMVEELIELINIGAIKFPYEYNGAEIISIPVQDKRGEETFVDHVLSNEEMNALAQIDLMKTEITSIQKSTNSEGTSVQYALSKDKQGTGHDDRFYVAILLAHRLYELRRGAIIDERKKEQEYNYSNSTCVSFLQF